MRLVELAEVGFRLGSGSTVKLNLKISSQDSYVSRARPNATFPASFQKTGGRTAGSGVEQTLLPVPMIQNMCKAC